MNSNQTAYNEVYVFCAWNLIVGKSTLHNNSKHYQHFLQFLIYYLGYKVTHLVVSLYLLYQYSNNKILVTDCKVESNFTVYLVLASLILTNHLVDDNVHTLQTWIDAINGIDGLLKGKKLNIGIIRDLKSHFLSAIELELSVDIIEGDKVFWKHLEKYLPKSCVENLIAELKGEKESFKRIRSTYDIKNASEPLGYMVPERNIRPLHFEDRSFNGNQALVSPTSYNLVTPDSINYIPYQGYAPAKGINLNKQSL